MRLCQSHLELQAHHRVCIQHGHHIYVCLLHCEKRCSQLSWHMQDSAELTKVPVLACGLCAACRTERLRGALTCYAVQNICIAASAAAAATLLVLDAAQADKLQVTQPVGHTMCRPS